MKPHAMETTLTPEQYLERLTPDRREAMSALRAVIAENLPPGFAETIQYGMISWVVPHGRYPAGYHCDPRQPLPFLSIASQKSHIALYHMGLYADTALLERFREAWAKAGTRKLDMGKSCIRFKKPEDIPLSLIGELCGWMSVDAWIALYESGLKRSTK